jgi:hypothetical protein
MGVRERLAGIASFDHLLGEFIQVLWHFSLSRTVYPLSGFPVSAGIGVD